LLILSCKKEDKINLNFFKNDKALILKDYEIDENILKIDFNKEIIKCNAVFKDKINIDMEQINIEKNTVDIVLDSDLEIAKSYPLDLTILDNDKNYTQFQINIFIDNPFIPDLKINEIYLNYKKDKDGNYKEVETIELKALSDGILTGVTLFYLSNKSFDIIYTFKDIEVKKDDFILLQARKKEIDNSLTFYIAQDVKYQGLSKTKGIIMLAKDKSFKNVIDSFVYIDKRKKTYSGFGNKYYFNMLKYLIDNKIWISELNPEAVINIYNLKYNQSISRKENDNEVSKENWYITDLSLGYDNLLGSS